MIVIYVVYDNNGYIIIKRFFGIRSSFPNQSLKVIMSHLLNQLQLPHIKKILYRVTLKHIKGVIRTAFLQS